MENNKGKVALNDVLLDKVSGGWEEILSDSGSMFCDCEDPVPSPLDPSLCVHCAKKILRE